MPHADYYNNAGVTISTPIVTFEPGEATQAFYDAYGLVIGNATELRNFLATVDTHSIPSYDDLKNPAVGNAALFDEATGLMQSIGSSWTPPAGVTVHQIAGVGEDTLAGITYKTVQECTQAAAVGNGNVICLEYQPALSYTPDTVLDGDGTVVTPSALLMSENADVERWWVDLQDNNNVNKRFWIFRLRHGNIFEVDELRSFIFNNLITKTSDTPPDYLSSLPPTVEGENRLHFILHSPLSLSVTSAEGTISETISTLLGATYKRYGEVQIITAPKDAFPTVHLDGVSDGSFTLEVTEYAGNTPIASTTFSGVPSTASTIVSMSFPDGTIQNAANLVIDYNGDNIPDVELEPEAGEIITLNDPALEDLLAILTTEVQTLVIETKLKNKLLKKIESLENKIEKKKEKNAQILGKLGNKIDKKALKGKIASGDADAILALLAEFEAQSDMLTFDEEILSALKTAITNLDAKQKLKNDLLKRVEKLENKQALTKSLSQFSATLIKKGEKGDIAEADVQKLLDLLGQIEAAI